MDYVLLTCSDGEPIELHADSSGLATGYGMIGNPYYCTNDPHWKWDDGDTVIECEASHPMAMPVADAYQRLYARWEDERRDWELMEERHAEDMLDSWYQESFEPTERLYEIQDLLMGY